MEAFVKRNDPDAISFAQILLTAIPESLRSIAATNLPAVSSILWEEFLDDKKPEWFLELPSAIQSYLIQNFGPSTAFESPSATDVASNSATTTQALSTPTSEASSVQTSDESSGTKAQSSVFTSIVTTSLGSVGIPIALPSNTAPTDSSPTSDLSESGLSRGQKIGIGVGVPLAILTVATLLGCCTLLRRRRKRSVNGSQPPSSPGFIPRFAFQEKGEDQTPLTRNSRGNGKYLSQDTSYSNYSNWDDDVIETMENNQRENTNANAIVNGGFDTISTHGAPAPAPPLYHTHSSNRARGKRTSYSTLHSLHSVAEVHEPDESPVLPRDGFRPSPPRRTSFGLNKRGLATAAAAASASQTLLRPVPDHSHSGSSNSTNSDLDLTPNLGPGFGNTAHVSASSASSLSATPSVHNPFKNEHSNPNPFTNDHYVEDYGPEYMNVYQHDDLENGLYGGHTDLSRYPQYPEVPAKNASRTEWPLRSEKNWYTRNKSPLWDRIYEG
ncbi:hypothetical protein K504DRAFT_381543 [Pleomassaria siparia CBS 279.74]|uniref:Uncharacterized protein n=1 Tax=Pleomassaria siparia CBS 279.74 TaxID=1314801 RepID=A0A6G1K7E6_9PLEO|nr:hypothetical protein K504DRAFT_381543 [Pleomassaria siparia CBS 279.74]